MKKMWYLLNIWLLLINGIVMANQFPCGLSARQGRRSMMEDAHVMQSHATQKPAYGIFDGHGGASMARYAAQHIMFAYDFFRRQLNAQEAVEKALVKMDDDFYKQYPQNSSGSTALMVIVDSGMLYLSHAGDSRAVVAAGGSVKRATIDHKPDEPSELKRIQAAGGTVNYVTGIPRVGPLAVSRALGDHLVKKENPQIIAKPDTITTDLAQSDFVILACDGLWDVLSNEEAVSLVYSFLKKRADEIKKESNTLVRYDNREYHHTEGNDEKVAYIARILRDTAYNKGSTDNISVILVMINPALLRSDIQQAQLSWVTYIRKWIGW